MKGNILVNDILSIHCDLSSLTLLIEIKYTKAKMKWKQFL